MMQGASWPYETVFQQHLTVFQQHLEHQREMEHSPESPLTKTDHISHEQYIMQLMEQDDKRPSIESLCTRSRLQAINAQCAPPKPRVQFTSNERDNADTNNAPSNQIVREHV